MMAAYKLRTRDLLSDVGKVPHMLAKGKLSLLPKRSGGAKGGPRSLPPGGRGRARSGGAGCSDGRDGMIE